MWLVINVVSVLFTLSLVESISVPERKKERKEKEETWEERDA